MHRDDFLLERREECTQISRLPDDKRNWKAGLKLDLIDFRMGGVEQLRDIEQTRTVHPASEKRKSREGLREKRANIII